MDEIPLRAATLGDDQGLEAPALLPDDLGAHLFLERNPEGLVEPFVPGTASQQNAEFLGRREGRHRAQRRDGRDGGSSKKREPEPDYIDYKDVRMLIASIPERGKIQPRRLSGTCAKHQRKLQTASKRARQIALIPYATD